MVYFKMFASTCLSSIEGRTGEVKGALQRIGKDIDFARDLGTYAYLPGFLAREGELLALAGRIPEALTRFAEAFALTEQTSSALGRSQEPPPFRQSPGRRWSCSGGPGGTAAGAGSSPGGNGPGSSSWRLPAISRRCCRQKAIRRGARSAAELHCFVWGRRRRSGSWYGHVILCGRLPLAANNPLNRGDVVMDIYLSSRCRY